MNDLGAMLNTIAEGCATVYRRGGDGWHVFEMLKALVKYHAVYYTKRGVCVNLETRTLWLRRSDGGLSLGVPGRLSEPKHGMPKLPTCDEVRISVPRTVECRMSQDQVTKLYNRLELDADEAGRLKTLFHEMNNSAAVKENEQQDVDERSQRLLAKWNETVKPMIKNHRACCYSSVERPVRWHKDVWQVHAEMERIGNFDHVIRQYLPEEGDDLRKAERTWVEVIANAMHASPYRSIDIMRIMYVGDRWMLARGLVTSCVSEDLRSLALRYIDTLRHKFGKARTMLMLDKEAVDCGSLKFLFTSAVSSYVSDVICQCVIEVADVSEDMSDSEWQKLFVNVTREVVTCSDMLFYATKYTRLMRCMHG